MKIHLVYNAQKNGWSAVMDYAHKVIHPSTYPCQLCALTHHHLGERASWKAFKARSTVELVFHYKQQFEEKFNVSYDYPVIVLEYDGTLLILLDQKEIAAMNDVNSLIEALENEL